MQALAIEADPMMATTLSAPSDRRREPRYVPVMGRAYLGWWEGDAFRTELGRLANISSGGAALVIDADPGAAEAVWLCAVGPGRMTWVPARLVGRDGTVSRIVFAEPFPYELFTTVVWGFPAEADDTAVEAEAGAEAPAEVVETA